MSDDDRRCAPRVRPLDGEPVEIQVMGGHFLDIFEARDISITGVGIFVPYAFEDCDLPDVLDLVVTLPGRPPFLAKGRLIHRSKTEREFFGVEFVNLTEVPSREIARYVESMLASASREAP